MIELDITPEVLKRAQAMADEMGSINRSILSGKGNLAGFVAEILVSDYYGYKHSNTYDYDLLNDKERIDVKTKQRTVPPKGFYTVMVASYQKDKQKCDRYIFTSVLYDMSKLWILGTETKEDFFKKADLWKKGHKDGPFIVKEECYSLPISKLTQL